MSATKTPTFQGHTVAALITTFAAFDCQHLAAELAARYELDVRVVGDGDTGEWHHAVTYHPETGLYIDITGVKTFDQVVSDWEGWDGWDGIHDIDDLPRWELGERQRPEVSVEAGIEMVLDQVESYGIALTERTGDTTSLRTHLGLSA